MHCACNVSWIVGELDRVDMAIRDNDDGTCTLAGGIGQYDAFAVNFAHRDALASFIERCQSALQDYDTEVSEVREMASE